MPDTPLAPSPEPPPIRSVWILGARITWILVGPLLTAAVVYAIIVNGRGWLTGWDALFARLVALMVAGRWAEFRSGAATTATGDPPPSSTRGATRACWCRPRSGAAGGPTCSGTMCSPERLLRENGVCDRFASACDLVVPARRVPRLRHLGRER